MQKKNKDLRAFRILEKKYPSKPEGLEHSTALQLLVATILSAQCTDKRVNIITKTLFGEYKDLLKLADEPVEKIEGMIRSSGFYRNKARNIKKCIQKIRRDFNGRVPSSMSELITLPGVARKTANIVLSQHFKKNEGIAVDTHVRRVSKRLGLTENNDPVKIEKDLMTAFDKKEWAKVADVLIQHGRNDCRSRNPRCADCEVRSLCPTAKEFAGNA